MKNCLNCQSIIPSDSDRTKFCSKTCCITYHNSLHSKRAKGWIPKRELERIRIEHDRAVHAEYSKVYISAVQLEELHGVSISNLLYYCKNVLGLEYKPVKKHIGKNFYSKDLLNHVDDYKNITIPDGYITYKQILEKLSISEQTFLDYKKKYGMIQDGYIYRRIKIYQLQSFNIWLENLKKQKEIEKQNLIARRLQNKKIKEINEIAIKEEKRQQKLQKKQAKLLEKEQRKKRWEAKKKQRLEAKFQKKRHSKYLKAQLNKETWEVYEEKLRRRIELNTHNKKNFSKGINNNKLYHSQHDLGNIIELTCNLCNTTKPYYNFYADITYRRGRRGECSSCSLIKKRDQTNRAARKRKTATSYLSIVITSIKRDLYKRNNKFLDISSFDIWKKLPYTKEELIEHIESLFEPWMNWENNGRASKKQKRWQLDHIVAKTHFKYNSMDDIQFQECWGLKNLKPIEAIVNIIKKDHRHLNAAVFSTLRYCIREKRTTTRWNYFFGQSSVEQYRDRIESNFKDGMSWNNWGTVWHLDHIVPCAALPWDTVEDGNFKILWNADNLMPRLSHENMSKGSKHDGKKYFLNSKE